MIDFTWFDQMFTGGEHHIDINEHFNELDINGDNTLDISDCPFRPGGHMAKVWFKEVLVPYTKSQVTPDLLDKYGDNLTGMYHGKPLIPGEAGPGQGDFEFLRDQLIVTEGFTELAATKLAAKIKVKLYG